MPYALNGETKIYWEQAGAGPALLLIMGNATTRKMWHALLPELVSRFTVITYDHRGVGDSDAPAGSYTIQQMAGDALAVLDAAGVQRAHVFGWSMGGVVAQELALTHADRVTSVVLAATAAQPMKIALARFAEVFAWPLTHLPQSLLDRISRTQSYASGTPEAVKDKDLRIARDAPVPARVRKAHSDAVFSYASRDRLPGLAAPTLVLFGVEDKIVRREMAEELLSLIPHAQRAEIGAAGHSFLTEQPQATASAITSFLESVEANAS